MKFRKKDTTQDEAGVSKNGASGGGPQTGEFDALLATERITLGENNNGPKPVSRTFPGPAHADVALRVAVERRAQADLIAHAKESLEVEVCGVLVGEVCEDGEGVFVHVEAVIRGTAAAEASTHVTFTQATWNAIHQTLERDFPKLRIVGWYHTHPGFGVEFSDMDLFVQKNFFPGPTQIALVTDPLSGAVAICVNTPAGARYLPRYWVDGREQLCRYPKREGVAGKVAEGGDAGHSELVLQRLEARVSQLAQIMDQQQASYYRFLLACGVVFCLGVVATTTYMIYSAYVARLEPPKLNSTVPIPVQVGDKTMLVQVGVFGWEIPDELNALFLEAVRLETEAAKAAAEQEAAAKEAAAKKSESADPEGARSQTNSQTVIKP
jgi:proteasome lid subunit RPN8/RPN11